jgi:hypothetical protein
MTELPGPVDPDRDDVLTLGVRTWRPSSRLGVITIIVAGVIVAGVATGLLATRHHMAANHPAPPSSVGVQPARPVTSASTASRPRTTLHASPLIEATGAQVFISAHLGWPLAWFSLDSSRLTPLELPSNAQRYAVQTFPGGALLLRGSTEPCDSCPGPPVAVYYAATGSRAVTQVGSTDGDVAVTTDHAAVWLSSYRLATEPYSSRSQALTVQKVDLSGHLLGPPVRLPYGYQLPVDPLGRLPQAPARLLLARTNPNPTRDRYTLWDPSTHRITASFSSVVAVSTHQIAWTAASCAEANCPLHLTDPITGTTTTQPPRPGQMPEGIGSYSPDGHYLALPLTAPADTSTPVAVEIGLFDDATHRLTVIPGTDLDIIPTLTWSADGRWLLITSLGDSQLGLVNPHTR